MSVVCCLLVFSFYFFCVFFPVSVLVDARVPSIVIQIRRNKKNRNWILCFFFRDSFSSSLLLSLSLSATHYHLPTNQPSFTRSHHPPPTTHLHSPPPYKCLCVGAAVPCCCAVVLCCCVACRVVMCCVGSKTNRCVLLLLLCLSVSLSLTFSRASSLLCSFTSVHVALSQFLFPHCLCGVSLCLFLSVSLPFFACHLFAFQSLFFVSRRIRVRASPQPKLCDCVCHFPLSLSLPPSVRVSCCDHRHLCFIFFHFSLFLRFSFHFIHFISFHSFFVRLFSVRVHSFVTFSVVY